MQKVKHFTNSEAAVTSIEYALLASLIAMMILSSVQLLGTNLLALYEDVATQVGIAVGGGR